VIVIVLVCIATATLFVVLAVELGKLMLGADRESVAVDRLLHGVAGTVKVAAGRFWAPTMGEQGARNERGSVTPGDASPGAAEAGGGAEEDQTWVRHDLEVEQLVRDRLYGARRLRERRD
jgi:hypothetical protein